jgi:hypothetical protein
VTDSESTPQPGESSPVFALLQEIDSAVKIQAWVLALMGLVAIPDICGALESENGWATKDKYFAWFGKYLGAHYPELGAEEFYKVRNSMLHTGNSRAAGYDRVIFPAPSGNVFDRNVLNDALQLDLPLMSQRMSEAVTKWRLGEGDTDVTRANETRMVQWYPNGLAPYMVGIAVLT